MQTQLKDESKNRGHLHVIYIDNSKVEKEPQ